MNLRNKMENNIQKYFSVYLCTHIIKKQIEMYTKFYHCYDFFLKFISSSNV